MAQYIPLKMHYLEYILAYGCERPLAPRRPTRENTPEAALPQLQSPENGTEEIHRDEMRWMEWISYPFVALMRQKAPDNHARGPRADLGQILDSFMGAIYEACSNVFFWMEGVALGNLSELRGWICTLRRLLELRRRRMRGTKKKTQ
ncbi:hypothetical protein MFRU_002g03390 [Monilinia fructicola]|nr:hypothetical protein MFRU_002g03390 [Monilinia fructicola]